MFELHLSAHSPEELKLQLLSMLSSMKGINFLGEQGPIDTAKVDAANVAGEISEEIKPVISQERMEENIQNAPKHEEPKIPPLEEVRQALKDLRDKKGSEAVKALLKEYGADSLPNLKEEDYLVVRDRALVGGVN